MSLVLGNACSSTSRQNVLDDGSNGSVATSTQNATTAAGNGGSIGDPSAGGAAGMVSDNSSGGGGVGGDGISTDGTGGVMGGSGGDNPASNTSSGGGTDSSGCPSMGLEAPAVVVEANACSTTRVVSVLNRDSEAVLVAAQELSGKLSYTGGEYPGRQGTCKAFITPGEVCELEIEVTPEAPFGDFEASIELDYTRDVCTRTLAIPVHGEALQTAILSAEPPELDFGDVTAGANLTIILTNEGDVPATDLAMGGSFENAAYAYFGGTFPGGGDCTDTLEAGESCTVSLSFTPEVVGQNDGEYLLSHDNGCTSQNLPVLLSGKARSSGSVSPSDALRDLGNLNCPAERSASWTLTNDGAFALTDISVSLVGDSPYSISANSCAAELSAGESCNIQVRHARSCSLPNFRDEASLTIGYNDGEPQEFTADIELFWYGCDSC